MAKYAMIYFLLGAAVAAWLDEDARRFLRTPAPWLALLIAVGRHHPEKRLRTVIQAVGTPVVSRPRVMVQVTFASMSAASPRARQ